MHWWPGSGYLTTLLVLYRLIDPPVEGLDRAYGVFLGLIASAGIAYGGWRAMEEEGTTFGDQADRIQTSDSGAGTPPPAAPPPSQQAPPAAQPPAQQPPPAESAALPAAAALAAAPAGPGRLEPDLGFEKYRRPPRAAAGR